MDKLKSIHYVDMFGDLIWTDKDLIPQESRFIVGACTFCNRKKKNKKANELSRKASSLASYAVPESVLGVPKIQ